MKHHSGLFFLFGLWLSFTGLLLAVGALVPVTTSVSALSPAAVARAVEGEELRESTTLPLQGKVITIDETGMKVGLYQDGVNLKAFRIIALGEPLSQYEVPTGSLSVGGKEPQHLSKASGLWMPYATEFTDNIYIHGQPQDEKGNINEKAAGVSVEVATADAKDIYDFAGVGVKTIVTGGYPRTMFASSSRYFLSSDGKLPKVSSPSFIIADIEDGSVLWERSGDMPRAEGELTTFATALTAVETLNQYKNVRIGALLLDPKAAHRLPPSHDDELPLGSLIYPLLFDANETASQALEKALANAHATALISERARAIGMQRTTFALGTENAESTTSAKDLLALLGYIDHNEHFLIDVSLSPDHAIFTESGALRYHWENKNPWVIRGDADYRGGFGTPSSAGAGSGMFFFSLPVSEFNDRTIAFVVLDSQNLEGDVAAMKEFVASHYRYGVRRSSETVAGQQTSLFERFKELFRSEITYDRDL